MEQEFLSAKQVADQFFNGECNYLKVLHLTREGILPAKKFGKSYLYKRSVGMTFVYSTILPNFFNKETLLSNPLNTPIDIEDLKF